MRESVEEAALKKAMEMMGKKVRSATTDPMERELCGVPIIYEDCSAYRDTWDEWWSLLNEWMPRFDEAGWLDELQRIEIGNGYVEGGGASGQYRHYDKIVALQQDPVFRGQPWLVGETKEYGLIHEMVHHVHIRDTFGDCNNQLYGKVSRLQIDAGFSLEVDKFKQHVSDYSAYNALEAVAETCTGTILGESYPAAVRRAYIDLGGPEPLDNWEEPPDQFSVADSNDTICTDWTTHLDTDFSFSSDEGTVTFDEVGTITFKMDGDQ